MTDQIINQKNQEFRNETELKEHKYSFYEKLKNFLFTITLIAPIKFLLSIIFLGFMLLTLYLGFLLSE